MTTAPISASGRSGCRDTMTPTPAATRTDLVDTTEGTVHMVIGGGGTSVPSMDVLFDTPRCNVIIGVGATGANGHKTPVYVTEAAPWSAVRGADEGMR